MQNILKRIEDLFKLIIGNASTFEKQAFLIKKRDYLIEEIENIEKEIDLLIQQLESEDENKI